MKKEFYMKGQNQNAVRDTHVEDYSGKNWDSEIIDILQKEGVETHDSSIDSNFAGTTAVLSDDELEIDQDIIDYES
jgi:hypothetical protein